MIWMRTGFTQFGGKALPHLTHFTIPCFDVCSPALSFSTRSPAFTQSGQVRPCAYSTLTPSPEQDSPKPASNLLPGAYESAKTAHEKPLYDVAIVGAGISGLAATVQAASKGLTTLTIEVTPLGREAAILPSFEANPASSTGAPRIELAENLQNQANELGAHLAAPSEVTGIAHSGSLHLLEINRGLNILSRAIVVATGARYCRLTIPNYDRYEYRGIHYAATGMEAALCAGEDVVVVGAGDSAGKAAVFLSGVARHVHLLIRGDTLKERMSGYLVERILHSPHITLHAQTEIEALDGDLALRLLTWNEKPTGSRETHSISNLFVMTGALPNSDWLQSHVALDAKGYVRTGFAHPGLQASLFTTSCPGVFAVGDVRAGSTRSVLAAVNEGRGVVSDIRRYLRLEG